MPKLSLAIAGVGVLGFAGVVFVLTHSNSAQSELSQAESGTNNTDSHHVLGNQSFPGGSAITGQGTSPGATDAENTTNPQQTTQRNANGGTVASGATSGTTRPAVVSPPATTTPTRTGYNLNENWYLATAGGEGLFNSCWPTELTQENEAQCIDESNPWSHYWFEGVGISKSTDEAVSLASAQVSQKANDKHVDLRRGGSDDPVLLTEAICASYGLQCSRW